MKAAQFSKVSESLPKGILDSQNLPKVTEMIKTIGENSVKRYIEFELIKLQALINTNGNLTDFQIKFIAAELIRNYPNEGISDFKLCFEMGAFGAFGEIWRLDSAVIGDWMIKYLEHKYQVIEDDLMKAKDNYNYKLTDIKALDSTNVAPPDVANKYLNELLDNLSDSTIKRVEPMTEEEIKKEGRERAITKNYPTSSLAEVTKHKLHIQYIKENYDPRTGDPLPGWVSEKEWLKTNQTKNKPMK